MIPERVRKNLSGKGYQIVGLEMRKKGVFYIDTDKGKLVLKTKVKRHNILLEIFNARSMSFRNECHFYDVLSKTKKKHFRIPEVIDTDNETYLLLDFVEGKERWINTKIGKSKMARALVEFQTKDVDNIPIVRNNFSKLLVMNYIWPLKFIIDGRISLLFKTIKADIACSLQEKEKNRIISNNDARNVIQGDDDHIYFFDLETCSVTRKWLFRDIVHLAYSKESIDCDIIREYIGELRKKRSFNTRAQLRKQLIQRIVTSMNSRKKRRRDRKEYYGFLYTFIDDDRYKRWYDKNIGID